MASQQEVVSPNGNPKIVMLFETYLEEHQNLEGNTWKIIRLFTLVNRDLYKLFLVSPVQSDFFRQITKLQGESICLPASKNLMVFGGVILKQNLLSRLKMVLNLVYYNVKMYRYLRRRRVDVVKCHNLRSLLMVGLAAKAAGKPLIWYVKSQLENPFLDRLGFGLADRIVFQNRFNRDRCYPRLVRRQADRIRILQEGLVLEDVDHCAQSVNQALKEELNWQPDRLNLIMLARLTPRKGAHVLLQAMVTVQQELPHVALYLVGDDATPDHLDYLRELKEYPVTHRLHNIYFTGWREDRLEILSLMDILVMPSSDEGLPGAILEAMALRKPVVATRVGGIPEVVLDEENGLLVESGDVQGLARAILRLARAPQLRQQLGARARKIVQEDYSMERHIANLEAIYQEMTVS